MLLINKKILLILAVFLLILTYAFDFYYLSKVKIFQPIKINISGIGHSDINAINIDCITPTNKKYKLNFDNKNNSWQSNYSFNKSIRITINDTVLNKIKIITLRIGNTIYKYDYNSFKNNWKSKSKNNILYFESPDNVRGSQSKLFMILSVFFWGGIFRIVFYTFLSLLLLFLLYKFYKYLYKKKIFVLLFINNKILFYFINIIKQRLNYLWSKKIYNTFIISFIFSFLGYTTFLIFRGFGWEGDSFGSAVQFYKILNPDIFCFNVGTVPKLFSIIFFGLNYLVFGSFYVLTFISIILNSYSNAIITKWINKTGGCWFFALFCMMLNISWVTAAVINADNMAFSFPFLFIGLYQYFYKNKKGKGLILLFISTMFRPGYEAVFIFLILYELYKRNFKIHWLFIILMMSTIHTVFGYKLAFCNKESFYLTCINFTNESHRVKYSFKSIIPYINAIWDVIVYRGYVIKILIVPAIIGLISIFRQKSNIKFILISFLTTLITLVAVFYYGNYIFAQSDQVIIITILMPITASYCRVKILKITKLNYLIVIFFTIVSIFVLGINGYHNRGSCLSHPTDGYAYFKGRLCDDVSHPIDENIIQCKKAKYLINKILPPDYHYRVLVNRYDRIFFILDCGLRAKSIDNTYSKDISKMNSDYISDNYDVILLIFPTNYSIYRMIKKSEYLEFKVDYKRTLFIRKNIKNNK